MPVTLDQWHEAMDMTSQYLQPKRNRRAESTMRTFKSGATRDSDDAKMDYEGFLCPLALTRYAEYMNLHRVQADGKVRDSDNWQKGIPHEQYVKSMFRHFMDLWTMHRGHVATDRKDGHVIDSEEALCAVIFNAFGLLHETLVDKGDPVTEDIRPVKCKGCGWLPACELKPERCQLEPEPLPAEAATDVRVVDKGIMFGLPPETVTQADYKKCINACINCSRLGDCRIQPTKNCASFQPH